MARKNDNWPSSEFDAPVHDLAADEAPPEGKKVIFTRVTPAAHMAIKAVAAGRGQSLESWVRGALNQALIAEGRDPLA